MQQPETLIDAVLEESGLTLQQLAAICTVETEWLIRHIEEGFIEPPAHDQNEWRFSGASLLRVRRIRILERDFEAVPELAALVADMQEEIAKLKRRLYCAGIE